jgi:class 3 adenylate cyclase/tetratricopeptide (TPR) repeat protein
VVVCSECGRENPDDSRFCNSCAAPLTPAPAKREQRKVVTVLFCDVTGSTSLGEQLDPEAMRTVMARYFETARTAIERHGGTVEKFIGDAVMAVFGVPVVHEDDALRAVRAAAELRDAVEIDVRIGVNTGEVVTGGADTLATGDAVNVAARLEQAASPGEVFLGAATYALVRDSVDAELLPPLEAKGKAEALTAYRLGRVRGEAARRDGSPMVGRTDELELLQRAYERAVRERGCHLFTVLGAAGVGKSRLAAELLATIEDARVLRGRCLSYGEGITYWPVVEVLKQLGDPGGDERVQRPISVLLGELDAPTTPAETAWAVRKALEFAAAELPLVVVFDDIHWGEPSFLDLIEHIADLSRDAPILLLCMARPELLDVRPGWSGGKLNATTVLLEPLGREETDQLVRGLLSEDDESLVGRIGDAAGGNPLFVEEMVELARESDGEVAVPPTIHALLAARLDGLPDDERAVLERGSVEGQVFHRGALLALGPEEGQVDSRLVALVRKELVRPDPPTIAADEAYRFRHLLVRDAAYESLPKASRAGLHERFASWLEEFGADLIELDEIVGYHLEQAAVYRRELGEPDAALSARAAERLGAAAERAWKHHDTLAGITLGERAAVLYEPGDSRRLALLPTLARCLHMAGRIHDSLELLAKAREHGNPVTSARARFLAAVIAPSAFGTGFAASLAEARAAIAELEPIGDPVVLAEAHVELAQILFWCGRVAEQTAAAQRGVAFARSAGDLHQEAFAVGMLAIAAKWGSMNWEEVDHFAREALEDSKRLGPRVELAAIDLMAMSAEAKGRFEEALEHIARMNDQMAEFGMEVLLFGSSMDIGHINLLAGKPTAAEQALREGWIGLGELGERGFRSTVGATLGWALVEQDRLDEAEQIVSEAEEIGSSDDPATMLYVLTTRARIASRRGEHERAVALANEAIAVVDAAEYVAMHIEARIALGLVLIRAGRPAEARAPLTEALERAEAKGALVLADWARGLLAETG